MRLSPLKAWLYGIGMIFVSLVLAECVLFFRDFISSHGKNILLVACWSVFFNAALFASYYSQKQGFILALTYVIVLPVLASCIHFVYGFAGAAVDLGGLQGAFAVFKIYLTYGALVISAGAALGALLGLRKFRCKSSG